MRKREVETILTKNSIQIVDHFAYSLSRQQRRKLEREYEGRPYGNVKLHARLAYVPPED